jgi:hypothetical protein
MGRGSHWGYIATGQRGWMRGQDWNYNTPQQSGHLVSEPNKDEITLLKTQAKSLEQNLKDINSRIENLEKLKGTRE